MLGSITDWIRSHPELRQRVRDLRMTFAHRRYGLRHVHPTLYIAGPGHISPDLVAGAYSYIGGGATIGSGVRLGRYVLIANHVAIVGGEHNHRLAGVPVTYSGSPPLATTEIGDDVWLGFRSTIMAGVRVGTAAVVAAGAVVTRDVEPFEIVGGCPARRIGFRFPDPVERDRHLAMLREPATFGILNR